MSHLAGQRVAYLSFTDGVHDRRWLDALHSLDLQVFRPRKPMSVSEVKVEPAELSICGPLNEIPEWAPSLSRPLIGLSWGFDLVKTSRKQTAKLLHRLDGLIVDNIALLHKVEAHMDDRNVLCMPWGVRLQDFPFRMNRATSTGQLKVVTLRTHEEVYRVADAILAFDLFRDRVANSVLRIGGDGTLTGDLVALVDRLGLSDRVTFTGRLSEAGVRSELESADVYLSCSEVDGSSVTMLQAMAVGVPVVVADTPSNASWIEQGVTGALFKVGDLEDIAARLEEAVYHGFNWVAKARTLIEARADWDANVRSKLADFLVRILDSK